MIALPSLASVAQADDVPATLRVAIDPTFPPMEFTSDGQLQGFDVDLFNAIAERMGSQVEWINTEFKGLVPSLIAKRADVVASAIYITEDRAKVVDFSDAYFNSGLVIVKKKGDETIQGPKDLDGKRVALQTGTKSVQFMTDNFPDVTRVEVEKNNQMFDMVIAGRADAVVTGKPFARFYATKRGNMSVLNEQLTTEPYGYAVRKDLPAVTTAINEALDALKADGTYQKITEKWFGAE
ncbi:transporter substrate-binding domain-containing protein [Salinicola rhizosphaerae]|nr:transporter substrate-binding domain-containing protein [Salinicola rhizosphaerae]